MADITITPANVQYSATTDVQRQPASPRAAQAIAAGEIVYQDTTNSPAVWRLADVGAAATAVATGMALNTAPAAGQPLDVLLPTQPRTITVGAHGVTVGHPVFLSNTAGKMCPFEDVDSGGEYTCFLGIANSANTILFMPVAGGVVIPGP